MFHGWESQNLNSNWFHSVEQWTMNGKENHENMQRKEKHLIVSKSREWSAFHKQWSMFFHLNCYFEFDWQRRDNFHSYYHPNKCLFATVAVVLLILFICFCWMRLSLRVGFRFRSNIYFCFWLSLSPWHIILQKQTLPDTNTKNRMKHWRYLCAFCFVSGVSPIKSIINENVELCTFYAFQNNECVLLTHTSILTVWPPRT